MKRRRFLELLGMSPAVPVLVRAAPAAAVPKPEVPAPAQTKIDMLYGEDEYATAVSMVWSCTCSAVPTSGFDLKKHNL